MKTLGLDLGGTKIAAAVVEDGTIVQEKTLPTPQTGFSDVLAALSAVAKDLLSAHSGVTAVGLGSPGPLNFAEGRIIFAPNIPGMENAPVVATLQKALGLEVVLENDANAAGFAEHLYGAAHDLESSIYVTISTGIGGGLFLRDEVLHGHTGIAGEIGHITLLPGGPLCGCGHHGCWEALASGRSIARDASFSYGELLSTRDVFARAQAGDVRALSVVDQAADFSGIGIANLLKTFDPDGFVIGGGMSQVGDFYLDKIRTATARYARGFAPADIRVAALGTEAGVIGAAAVAARRKKV